MFRFAQFPIESGAELRALRVQGDAGQDESELEDEDHDDAQAGEGAEPAGAAHRACLDGPWDTCLELYAH